MSCPIRARQMLGRDTSNCAPKPSNAQLFSQNEKSLKDLMESRRQQDQYFYTAFAGTDGHPAQPLPEPIKETAKTLPTVNMPVTYPLSN
jgi:hypothetical protein